MEELIKTMLTIKDFKNVDDTVMHIIGLIKKHSGDPALDDLKKNLHNPTMQRFFDFISKEIEYLKDPQKVSWLNGDNIELLRSPKQTLMAMAGDCDCKAILAGSYFHKNNLPVRIAIVSERDDRKFHHVYPEVMITEPQLNGGASNRWIPFDATYKWNKYGVEKPFTAKRVYYDTPTGIVKEDIL